MTTTESSQARAVGDYYDHDIFDAMKKLGDGNMHYGFWTGEEDQSSFEEAMEQMTTQMIRRLDPLPGATILDVGCGNGTPALRLAREREVRVVGITVSERQVERANERARSAGLGERARFELASAMDIPHPDESFDGAWALESMLHMPDKSRVLAEIVRVLRPGSRLAISDMFFRSMVQPGRGGESGLYGALTGFAQYAGLLEEAGLIPLEVRDVTAETSRSSLCFADWMRAERDHYVEVLGTKGYELMVSTQESIARLPQLGYALITAERPRTRPNTGRTG
ncbi:SAM-dependent methyltransferase [Actinomadura macra]|uniref:SAM-dependent methyltransferase n=1 Tax=Actinomadura macra TaxID=46164 RepID=UPI000AF375E4|nr:methyltransferase domain-containing protein [Actinomadura macra]